MVCTLVVAVGVSGGAEEGNQEELETRNGLGK